MQSTSLRRGSRNPDSLRRTGAPTSQNAVIQAAGLPEKARTGIGATSVQNHLKVLAKRQMVSISKHRNAGGRPNNEYTLLSLDNPEVYRDLKTADKELPLFVGEELPL